MMATWINSGWPFLFIRDFDKRSYLPIQVTQINVGDIMADS